MKIRTRFAPSPTGFMHVGNLRTALYEYLTAKHEGGTFVLRIEDTDRERYVEGATQVIYDTMKLAGLSHDEGPDIGGDYGPYVQSERLSMYKPYAEKLVEEGKAYRCFCTKERLEALKENAPEGTGYDRHCSIGTHKGSLGLALRGESRSTARKPRQSGKKQNGGYG